VALPAAVRSDDRRGTPQTVDCARCGASVQVVKFSPQHTSVQWTAAAAGSCAEFRARAAEGTASALVGGCGTLRASIDHAVTAGALTIVPPSYSGVSAGEAPRAPGGIADSADPGDDSRAPGGAYPVDDPRIPGNARS
jgi:hypothetical protein